jgi:hypothetical protein
VPVGSVGDALPGGGVVELVDVGTDVSGVCRDATATGSAGEPHALSANASNGLANRVGTCRALRD